ncbi:hypothetical protein EDB83DRAFT_2321327 [Lactarius deliciosus]|nr:hypothetical protein EDB83DRAFT_2321327 [Lactarius deliciosus]
MDIDLNYDQCMPVRRTSQNWGQPTTQPNDLYPNFNDVFWGSGLQLGDIHEQGMFPSNNDYELFLSNYNVSLQQAFNPETYGEPGETHNLGYPESSATAMHPSFIPTSLPVAMGIGFLPLGESPPSKGGDANWQSSWESEEVDVDLSMRVRELRLEGPMPSTSNSTAGTRGAEKVQEKGGKRGLRPV